MAEASSRRRQGGWPRVFARLQRPRVTLALLVLALLDLFTLAPGHDYRQDGSRIGNAVGSLRPPILRRELPPTPSPHAYFAWYAENDELRRVNREERREDDWAVFCDAYSSFVAEQSGWWGLTRERRGFSWIVGQAARSSTTSAPPDLADRVNRAFVEHIRESGDAFWITEAERAFRSSGNIGYWENRVRWQGWVRNALSAMLWSSLLLSLPWIWRAVRERRRWRRLARRVCPDCRYELGTIPNHLPCPECGNAHPARQAMKPRDAVGRAWHRVCTPWATLALAAVLALDVLLLPKSLVGHGSRVANFLPTPTIRTDRGDGRPVDKMMVAVVRSTHESLAFQVIGDEWPTAVGGSEAAAWNSEDTVELEDGSRRRMSEIMVISSLVRDSYAAGFWAPVRVYIHCNYGGWGWDRLPTDFRNEFEDRQIEWLEETGHGEWAADLRLHRIHAGYHGRALWMGHIHNLMAMGVGLALICSATWAPALVGRLRMPARGSQGRCWYCLAPREEDGACRVCGEPEPG